MDTSFDQEKVSAAAERLLNQLARMVKSNLDSSNWGGLTRYQRTETGNAVALIMSLRKDVDGPDTIP
jgi:hypothetical protein